MGREDESGELEGEDLKAVVEQGVSKAVGVDENLVERVDRLQEFGWGYLGKYC